MIKVKVPIRSLGELLVIMVWCEETFGLCKTDRLGRWTGGRWSLAKGETWAFAFAYSADATLFELKWL